MFFVRERGVVLDVVLNGMLRNPVGPAETYGRQVVRLDEAVYGHPGQPHDFGDFGNGQESGVGKTFSGHFSQLSWDVVQSGGRTSILRQTSLSRSLILWLLYGMVSLM